jgi:superfamily I DNA/RNA helicase
VRDGKEVDEKTLDETSRKIGVDFYGMAKDFLKDEIVSSSQRIRNPGIRKIPIKATTIESSKGLADEYVFITNFDDRHFIKDKDKKKISDKDICNFLVALTRARKKVFLISTDNKNTPTFLQWINPDRIETYSPKSLE